MVKIKLINDKICNVCSAYAVTLKLLCHLTQIYDPAYRHVEASRASQPRAMLVCAVALLCTNDG